ncbi:hypothetical protein [Stappia sp.]|uniref:hypothetical protein n=1 Tax=Stappia sp. TaxID=1870903 RepID=UPI003C79EA1C
MAYGFEFMAHVPLVISGVTIAEDVECDCWGNYDPGSQDGRVEEITLGLGERKTTLHRQSNDPERRMLFVALAPRVKASAGYSDALNALLRGDPNAEHALGAFETGVSCAMGRYA